MEEFLISIAALVILVPIVYFLPLGLSKKGKITLIVTALFLANLGLLTRNQYPLWQVVLILLLLLSLITYVIDRRFGKQVYKVLVDKEITNFEEFNNVKTKVEPKQLEINNNLEHSLNEINLEEFESIIDKNEQKSNFNSAENFVDLEGINIDEIQVTDSVEPKVPKQDVVLNIAELEDSIEFFNDKESTIQEPISTIDINHDESAENEVSGYMSDIEKLLEGDLDLETLLLEENQVNTSNPEGEDRENIPLDIQDSDYHIEELNLEEISMGIIASNVSELDFDVIEEINIDNGESITDALENIQIPILTDIEEIKQEHLNSKEYESVPILTEVEIEESTLEEEGYNIGELGKINNNEKDSRIKDVPYIEVLNQVAVSFDSNNAYNGELNQPRSEQNDEIHHVMITEELQEENLFKSPVFDELEDMEEQTKQRQKTLLQQKLFQTMVDQLYVARKTMLLEEYESLIIQHLHPDMSVQEYYTFASLLIQHYITHKERPKLKVLLEDLIDKMEDYPVLEMEIQYLYEQYC
ncbi:hypothetical protein SM124_03450 (plasmid) [Bacillus sp. 31A1R]|uniref:MFS transporter n=1 Tax=Robertmurraya mangrovi TaxID=3098077 RepID=A0ABU5IUH5_9BACI|nr:hypothetical protein [Bacillus sp. 31A1R]MDZ5470801.1 hypothetical protein [Bacillus sp. 31A1R]